MTSCVGVESTMMPQLRLVRWLHWVICPSSKFWMGFRRNGDFQMATCWPICWERPCLQDNRNSGAMKFSYHASIYPRYYPEELGRNWISRILKDYNGQTYWLSFNIKSFLSAKNDFPSWLNMSFGYGAEGMIGARTNPTVLNGQAIPAFPRYRQFYFAPDVDLLRVPSNSQFFNAAAYFTRFIKFPAPALEWNTLKRVSFRPLYF